MKNPEIDVLLPIRNPNIAWLDQTLESIRSQRGVRPRTIAILHPDDSELASTIKQKGLLHAVAFAEPGGNLSDALNIGLDKCVNEYAARIDQDDLAEPDRFLRQFQTLTDDPKCCALGTSATLINHMGVTTGTRDMPTSAHETLKVMRWKSALIHPSVMFRTAAVIEAKGYSSQAENVEDYDLWLRLLAKFDIRSLPERLTRYRIHGNQMTQTRVISKAARLCVAESRFKLAKERNESHTLAKLRQEVWEARQEIRMRNRTR